MSVVAAATNNYRASVPKFRYLSAWFCPFAHRCTMALEHHRGRVDYEWVEALGWEKRNVDNQTNATAGDSGGGDDGHEWIYHWKSPELVRACPGALVPTLIPIDNHGQADESKSVYESIVTIEYVDAVSGAQGKDRLVSEDPFLAARARVWADKVNRECCSPYYGVLVRKDDSERREHFDNLIKGLEVREMVTKKAQ
jgi:glutathione S-transferase